MATYVIEIYHLDVVGGAFSRIDILTTGWKDLTYFNKLNGIGAGQFKIAIQHPKATEINFRRYVNQICIKRDDTVVFFGPITSVIGDYDNVAGYLTIDFNSYQWHLSERYSAKLDIQTTQDLSTITWYLINLVQSRTNGNLLITQGSLATTVSYPKSLEYTSVEQLLDEYSAYLNGFDYTFTPVTNSSNLVTSVRFDTYNPRIGSLRADLVPLQIGENVKSFNFKTDKEIFNSGIGEGAGTGSDVFISTLDYGGSEQAYTRREVIQTYKNESVPSNVSTRLTGFLNQYSVENYLITVELYPQKYPLLGTYNLGDQLNIDLEVPNSSYATFVGTARVLELSVVVDENGSERIMPKLQFVG